MARASYDYGVQRLKDKVIITIVDNDNGMSVTNDIENVVEEIGEVENVDPKQCIIIYRDSFELWDGWDHVTQTFIPLQCKTPDQALNKILNKQAAA